MRNWKSLLVGLLILLVGAAFIASHRGDFFSVSNISLVFLVPVVASQLLFLTFNGLFLLSFASKFDISLSLREWFGLSVITSMSNYIAPFSGGMVVRATYLKAKHRFPYASFVSTLAAGYAITFLVCGALGMFASLFSLATHGDFSVELFLFFGFLIVATVVVSSSPLGLLGSSSGTRLARAVSSAVEGWNHIKGDWKLLQKLGILSVANYLLTALSLFFAYRAFAVQISFINAFLIGLLSSLSILINVTPGNLGIREAVVSLSSGLLGVGLKEGFLGALLVRVVKIVIVFTLGPIFGYLLASDSSA